MKTKILTALYFLLFFNSKGQGLSELKFDVEQISAVKWGSAAGEITYKMVPGANLGATSFFVIDGFRIAYLINSSNEIMIVGRSNGKLIKEFKVAFAPRDFVYDKGYFYVLFSNYVTVYDSTGLETKKILFPDSYLGVERLARYQNATYLILPTGNSLLIESAEGTRLAKEFEGVVTEVNYFVKTRFTNANSYSVKIISSDKTSEKVFLTDRKLAGVFVAGATANRIIFDVQTFVSENPISIERSFIAIEVKNAVIGNITAKTKVPNTYYVLSNKDIYATGAGNIFNMVSAPAGVYVFSLSENQFSASRNYPTNLTTSKYHFNDHLLKVDK